MAPSVPLQICLAEPDEFAICLQLVVMSWPAAYQASQVDAFLSGLAAAPQHYVLLAAKREGRIVGAVLAQLAAGRSAGVYPPQLFAGEDEATATHLLQALHEHLIQRGVHLAQSLLTVESGVPASRMLAAGYEHVADLLYLLSEVAQFPDSAPSLPFSLEAYDPSHPERLERLIEATYVGTLDCPLVEDLRDTADVLAGYRAMGAFDPTRWLLATSEGRDIGCLILTDFPNLEAPDWSHVELVYLGLIPAVRRRGWGIELARQAQWIARQANRSRILSSVDSSNIPAIRAYAACAFGVCDERSVFVKGLRKRATT